LELSFILYVRNARLGLIE